MSELILHAYDASPFTQRALRFLGFKSLDWRWVETPLMPPKDDLIALTGGYRGTPVLQVGNDVYIDSRLIALELERRHPQPSLFPVGNTGIALALVAWADVFFRTALKIIIATSAHLWPEAFRKDRETIFPDLDFQPLGAELDHVRSQYQAHAWFLERQLADGRDFVGGQHPGMIDAVVHPVIWVMRQNLPEMAADLLGEMPHLAPWEERVAKLGDGHRTRISAATALEEAKAAKPPSVRAGERVSVAPDDTCRGTVTGQLVSSGPGEIVVLHTSQQSGPVLVHFPRAGYRITQL